MRRRSILSHLVVVVGQDLVSLSTVGKKDKLDFIELLAGKWLKMVEPSLEGVVGFGSRRQRL